MLVIRPRSLQPHAARSLKPPRPTHFMSRRAAAASSSSMRRSDDDQPDRSSHSDGRAAQQRGAAPSAAAAAAAHSHSSSSSQLVAPFFHWPHLAPTMHLLPPASSDAPAASSFAQHSPPLPLLRNTPEIVLNNSGAMVVYDPPAGELVVYKHPSAETASSAATAAAHAIAASSLNAMPSSLAPLLARGRGGGGGGDLQPYLHTLHPASGSLSEIPSCRLCHRPFWPSFPHDVDEDFGTADTAGGMGGAAGSGGGMGRRQFTSSDYFHLLHATEQAADASREHSARASDAEDAQSKHEEQHRRGRPRNRRGRSEQRGSVEIIEELPDTAPPAARTRRAAAAAARSSVGHSSGEHEIPIVRTQQGRSSRAGTGIRARRGGSGGSVGDLSVSSSTEDFTTVSAASPAHIVEEVSDDEEDGHGGDDDEAADLYDDGSSATAASAAVPVLGDSDLLACGLHRSSFNSGYYSKFFREECKLGSGGVGGVYLTHHVLDDVMLGTYAVKKIPVGNSRAWLLQVLKEVRALEGLHHRHIVAYKHSWLEAFKPSDFGPAVPCLFLLMEYANRGTLANLIWPKVPTGSTGAAAARARAAAAGGDMPQPTYMQEEDVWWVFIGTCLGLRHLHRAGVIHRDLKPENLLMTVEIDALGREHGVRVLVSDFGNAILKGVPYNRTGNTGTLAYSAPETLMPPEYARRFMGQQQQQPQAAASSSSSAAAAAAASSIEYDEHADLWSIGVILYAMAFGRLPFLSNSPEALFAEIQQKGGSELLFPSAPARSPELKQIIRDLLALDPNKRPGLDDILSRPAVARRRAQRYAEFQAYRTQSAAASHMRQTSFADRTGETFRPPVIVSDFGTGSSGGGHGAAAARAEAGSLVISPSLLSAPHQQRARSKSPAPLSLNAPKDSPTGSPAAETRSLRSHSEIGELPGTSPPSASSSSSVAAGREPSTALVLSSSAASHRGVVVEDASRLSPPLSLLLMAFNSLASLTSWSWSLGRPAASSVDPLESDCWRCRWSPAKEGGVHLVVFGLKLWLGLSLLIDRPSASSMYLHVFPQVLVSLLLFFTTPLTLTSYWLQQLQFPSLQHDGSTMLPRVARAMHGWSTASPLRWQLLRMALSLTACLLTAWWMHDASSSVGWQSFNALIALVQCASLLCTYFAAHASHQLLHPPLLRRRGVANLPLRTKLARSLSPLSLAAIPRSSGAGGVGVNGPSAPPSGSSTPAHIVNTSHPHHHTGSVPVARVPLLLPPTPAPSERGGESPMSHAADARGRVVLAPRPQLR